MDYGKVVRLTLLAVELGGTVVGNALLLVLLWKSRQLHRSASKNFIFNCASTDLVSALINIPLAMDYVVFKTGNLNGAVAPVAVNFMMTFFARLNLRANLMIIADRLFIVKYPVEYNNMMTVKRARAAIIMMWLANLVSTSIIKTIRIYIFPKPLDKTFNGYMETMHQSADKYFILIAACVIITPLVGLSGKLYRELQKLVKPSPQDADNPRKRAERRKIASSCRTVLLVMIIYLLCYIPLVVNAILEFLSVKLPNGITEWRGFVVHYCAQLPTLIDPIVFIVLSSVMRASVVDWMLCRTNKVRVQAIPRIENRSKAIIRL